MDHFWRCRYVTHPRTITAQGADDCGAVCCQDSLGHLNHFSSAANMLIWIVYTMRQGKLCTLCYDNE